MTAHVIGTLLSHYRILEPLGAGGMGEVFLAEDVRLKRQVAIKFLRVDGPQPHEARGRLLREARAASALNHPNIAVIYETDEIFGEDGSVRPFIALEYVKGRPIVDHVRTRATDIDGILDLATQVADALAEAHRRGVVHRDIKPSNVLVTDAGRVKILDFGLAKFQPWGEESSNTWTRDVADRTASGRVMGTLAYMSPEQALGKDVDGRTDVFSLGALLYELLCEAPPFQREGAVATLDAILREPPPPLPARLSDPRRPRIEALLGRMLAKDRGDRYATIDEVAADLRSLRHATGSFPAAVALSRPAVAVLPFANITGGAEDEWLGAGIAETVSADLGSISGLAVVRRAEVEAAVRQLRDDRTVTEADIERRVGTEVNARYVVGGGFQRIGDNVRVTARLTDLSENRLLRTVKVDGAMGEIFAVQDRLVRELSSELSVKPPSSDDGGETHVVAAYEAFSKGLLNQDLETFESLERAILLYEKATALDPNYARAHVALGGAYSSKADYLAAPELNQKAVASLRRAIDLNPKNTRAWRDLGLTFLSDGRDDEAIEAIRQAMTLSPNAAGPLSAMGRALFIGHGDFEGALNHFERAVAADPKAGWFWLQLAHCATLTGRLDRAEEAVNAAVAMQEASLSGSESVHIAGAYMRRGHVRALQGRFEEAAIAFEQELRFVEQVDHALRRRMLTELHTRSAEALQGLGREEGARIALDRAISAFETRLRLGADDPFTRYYAACAYALRGNISSALGCLERAARLRPALTIARARNEPLLRPLHGEPAFTDILARGR